MAILKSYFKKASFKNTKYPACTETFFHFLLLYDTQAIETVVVVSPEKTKKIAT